ncbi:polycomb group protein ASXL1 isoform X3 [Canis lupus baileyi]|uniref:polycomb group protein ASXL1 isoform X5 n=1 Tax=Canis lupus familiaris TaxID=9615 RepID=UPI0015F19E81|nr:polycomb group protein ASXL1 isoform X5 [Canis lupus familiaris]XP_038427892.1 polycomb group protein ASXL1 isoform X5 [Canis lupus familiaris]
MKDKQKRKKERTWAEAARLVLENYSDAPMTPKQILQVIEAEGLKEMRLFLLMLLSALLLDHCTYRSGTSPLACLNAMLHSNSRGGEGLFYKLPGRISLFTLKKDALQWSRSPAAVEGEEPEDTADVESCGSNEASTVSGENDVSLDETSSNASCSAESQSRPLSNPRDTYRASSQANKQKKKTGVMLPRVVLTPLKVNGAHVESASGFSGRHADGESGSPSSSSSGSLALGSAATRGQAEVARDPAPLLRGFRKPATGQMKRNRGEEIDFETPGSILVNTNLRALINSRTFHALPAHFQQQLLFLLPEVDRQVGTDGLLRLSSSALNNEFFTHAAQSWRERLADGEFTHEMQVRIRQEMEKEKKVEQWKEKFFEDYYGQKLGLTKEESLHQNVGHEEAEIKSDLCVPGESARPQRGPATRQRDGHFKKRSRPDLRTRARRNLYKKQEPEQAGVAKDTQSVAPDIPLYKDGEAKSDSAEAGSPHLPGSASAAPDPESPEFLTQPVASRTQTDPGDLAHASVSPDRIPSLPQENADQEPKDQKRKSFEQAASASFPEKKPRLEDRQSFRNTIESVHTEKPQPTKEEPKVPPIRIQLSRIKPPWVVKGQPTYQICPRIVPITESSCRGWTGARTLADIKARALQVRGARGHHCHREAATTAIGGGGGPGGGGGGATDEGGGRGGGSGDGGEACGHPEPSGAPDTPGERASDLQRTQLLPSCPLNGEHIQAGTAVSRARREELIALRKEESCPLQRVPDVLTSGLEVGASQLPIAPTGDKPCQALPLLSSQTPAPERLVEQPPLHLDVRTEHESGTTSWENDDEDRGPSLSAESGPVQSLVGDVVLEGGPGQALERDSNPSMKDPVNVTPNSASESPLANCLQDRQYDEELGLGDSSSPTRESATRQEDLTTEALVSDGAAPWVPGLSKDEAVGQPEPDSRELVPSVEPQAVEEWEKAAAFIPALPGELTAGEGLDPPNHFPLLWTVPSRGCTDRAGSDRKPVEGEKLKINGDSEALSPHGESTDTASDFEGQLSEDSSEADPSEATMVKRALVADTDEKRNWNPSASLSKVNGDRSLVTRTDSLATPQSWVSRVCAVPQKIPDSLLLASTEYQPRLMSLGRAGSSLEATNPLVMQLLQGNLPLEKVLPPAQGSSKPESPGLPLMKEQSLGSSLGAGALQDSAENSCAVGRSSPRAIRASKEPLLPDSHEAGTSLARLEPTHAPGAPQKISKTVPSLDSLFPVTELTTASGKVEEVDSKERFSTVSLEDQKEAVDVSQRSNSNAAPGKSPGNLTTSRDPCFSSPNAISLDPDQTGRALGNQNSTGGQGKKLFGPRNEAAALQCPRPMEPTPLPADAPPSFPSRKLGPSKNSVSGGVQTTREDWAPKPPPASVGSIKSEKTFEGGPLKANAENRNATGPGPRELVDHLQGMPFVLDLPFWKLPREPGKGPGQPLEPSSIPSQLNIKQAFYGKLSKLQLSSTSFNYASSSPTFPKGLAGSVVQLSHKANFGASHSASLSLQMFTDSSTVESISLQCACSLKAMIMCQGCGAFCHDDCIGPSKLCVLCLVVR